MTGLDMWVVYSHPRDFPGCAFVARRWEIGAFAAPRPTDEVLVGEVGELRRQFADRGLVQLDRHTSDDPAIVEVWI